jgi:hypothetical protein
LNRHKAFLKVESLKGEIRGTHPIFSEIRNKGRENPLSEKE